MLTYSVIDKRLRKYLGTVQGETHAKCWEAARKKFETRFVRIDCYPSPPEYKGPPRLETEDVEPVVSLKPGNGQTSEVQGILKDSKYSSVLDHRYTGEDFGYNEAIVVNLGAAEQVLSLWARQLFGLGQEYVARVNLVDRDFVVVVTKCD